MNYTSSVSNNDVLIHNYNGFINNLPGNPELIKDIVSFGNRLYRYNFFNVVAIFNANSKATLVGSFDNWKAVGRVVMRGEKGILIGPEPMFKTDRPSRVFDISQTTGRNVDFSWHITPYHLDILASEKGVSASSYFDNLRMEILNGYGQDIENELQEFAVHNNVQINVAGLKYTIVSCIIENIKIRYTDRNDYNYADISCIADPTVIAKVLSVQQRISGVVLSSIARDIDGIDKRRRAYEREERRAVPVNSRGTDNNESVDGRGRRSGGSGVLRSEVASLDAGELREQIHGTVHSGGSLQDSSRGGQESEGLLVSDRDGHPGSEVPARDRRYGSELSTGVQRSDDGTGRVSIKDDEGDSIRGSLVSAEDQLVTEMVEAMTKEYDSDETPMSNGDLESVVEAFCMTHPGSDSDELLERIRMAIERKLNSVKKAEYDQLSFFDGYFDEEVKKENTTSVRDNTSNSVDNEDTGFFIGPTVSSEDTGFFIGPTISDDVNVIEDRVEFVEAFSEAVDEGYFDDDDDYFTDAKKPEPKKSESFSKPTHNVSFSGIISLSDEEISDLLRTGGGDQNSRERIYEKYREDRTHDYLAEFLKKEYATGGAGYTINGKDIALWYDENGIRFGQLHKADRDYFLSLSWSEVESRISNLIEHGEYLSKSEAEKSESAYKTEIASNIYFFCRDVIDEHPKSLESTEYGFYSYPDMEALIEDKLSSEDGKIELRDYILDRVDLIKRGDIEPRCRLRPSPEELADKVSGFVGNKKSFPLNDNVNLLSISFITEDEIDHYLSRRGSGFEGGRGRIYTYYQEGHTQKEFADFLKKEFGTGGCSPAFSAWRSSEDHDAKGIRFAKGNIMNPAAKLALKWDNVAKRIKNLIDNGLYLTAEEIAAYESRLNSKTVELNLDETAWSKKANDYINRYTQRQSGHDADFKDLAHIIIDTDEMIDEVTGESFQVQAEADLISYRLVILINQEEYTSAEFNDLKEFCEVTLCCLERSDLFDFDDDQLEEIRKMLGKKLSDDEIESILEKDRDRYEERYENEHGDTAVTEGDEEDNVIPFESGGAKTKYNNNVDAIKTLKRLEKENREANGTEKYVLSRYVGWGGLPNAFNERDSKWKKEYAELRELLSDDEYEQAKASTLNSFYTPQEICTSVIDIVRSLGFENGRILEPSMAIGNFFTAMPRNMRDESKLYGVEIDSITGRIGKYLHPEVDVQVKGFEDTTYEDGSFDLVIGNVPFGNYGVYDRRYNDNNFKIHDYFFAKSIDKVRVGGLIAFITSKGTMDKKNSKVRRYIGQRAELLGAIRLPNNAFKDYAGTETTTDIIILKKRDHVIADISEDWIDLGLTDDNVPVNMYFVDNPDMMLGKMVFDERVFGQNSNYTTCIAREDISIRDELARIIRDKFSFSAYSPIETEPESITVDEDGNTRETINALPDLPQYRVVLVEGKPYIKEGDEVRLINATYEQASAFINLRDSSRNLITIQNNGCTDEEFNVVRDKVSSDYEKYVKLCGNTNLKKSDDMFGHDNGFNLIRGLEVPNEDGKTYRRSDTFLKRTIRPYIKPDKAETAVDALNLCINEYGLVDMYYILSLYKPDINDLIKEESEKTGRDIADIETDSDLTDVLILTKLTQELKGVIFLNPTKYDPENIYKGWETSDEYLSGNVRKKLREAQNAEEKYPGRFAYNVDTLTRVLPDWLSAGDIEVRLGATWIEEQDYEQFIYELIGVPSYFQNYRNRYRRYSNFISVEKEPVHSTYFIKNKSLYSSNAACREKYGTERKNAYEIIEDSLNLKKTEVRDRIDDGDGKYHYVVNRTETILARQKQDIIKEAFAEWIFNDPERRAKYEEIYNERFNSTRLRQYDGSILQFPGMSTDITLRKHQKDAVARVIMGGNTLLAHSVGAGKSFEMIAGCMEMKRLGIASKPAIIVPKPIVGQIAAEFMRLYPGANILVTRDGDFTASNRKRFMARIATGDYDAIIMSNTQFSKPSISKERRIQYTQEQIDTLVSQRSLLENARSNNWTVKQIQSFIKELELTIKKLHNEESKDDFLNFEELGIDAIYVDEAHYFKNLPIFSKMRVSGISNGQSQRATDMELKCRYINEINNGGKGVIFATGTPISNSMSEMFVMQKFLQPNKLEEYEISNFDSWASTFGEITSQIELSVEGKKFKEKSRFNKFVNIPELMNIFREVADIQLAEDLNLDLPKIKTGKPIIIKCDPDEYTKLMMDEISERADRIHSGGVDASRDNFLKLTSDARLLGTDPRLIDPYAPISDENKLQMVVDNVAREYFEGNKDGKIGCQLIFSDVGTPGNKDKFDVYNCIKEGLIEKGIPAKEIAFVHDAKTDTQRTKMFDDVQDGKIKILMGSTQKLGTGVNVQRHIIAMHHVDCPWKPSDIEQREGRGIRQGNENSEVAIYRYVTAGTFDGYSWNLVENKQRFISAVMRSKTSARTCNDVDEVLFSYAEIKAIASGNPELREKVQLEEEIAQLRVLKAAYKNSHFDMQTKINITLPKQIELFKQKITNLNKDIDTRNLNSPADVDEPISSDGEVELIEDNSPGFSFMIGGKEYTSRKEAGEAMIKKAADVRKNTDAVKIGKYRGFDVSVISDILEVRKIIKIEGEGEYTCDFSYDTVGITRRIDNALTSFEKHRDDLIEKVKLTEKDISLLKEEYEKPFQKEDELQKKKARLEELNNILCSDDSNSQIIIEEPEKAALVI